MTRLAQTICGVLFCNYVVSILQNSNMAENKFKIKFSEITVN